MAKERSSRGRRPRPSLGRGIALATAATLVVAGCTSDDESSDDEAAADVPADAQAVVDRDTYDHGWWSYDVVDAESGERLYGDRQDEVSFLGSTTKLFTVGTYYDEVGVDATLTTPVYAVGDRAGEDLQGDLVLVGSGDFILGSRGVEDGPVQFERFDHVYAYATPLAQPVEADPLVGLDLLAAQVREAGIGRVSGDVLVDDRLWEPYESKEGIVTPIMVNDNLLDLEVTPGAAEGDPADVAVRPDTAYFPVVNEVTTTAAGGDADLTATVGGDDVVTVTGELPVDADRYALAVFAPDPAAYARALFIEALGRAGVTVDAPLAAPRGALPAEDTYDEADEVASLTSPPVSELGTLVLKVSHNRGAETLMCLLAVEAGSDDCLDGLTTMLEAVEAAGIDSRSVYLYDGEGTDPASATPASVVEWLAWVQDQPWGATFEEGLPDVAGDGSIMAKSGTSARPQQPPMPSLFVVNGEAGFMTAASGRRLIVAVYASNGSFPTVAEGLEQGAGAVKDWMLAVQAAE